jgi:hypothetical protein
MISLGLSQGWVLNFALPNIPLWSVSLNTPGFYNLNVANIVFKTGTQPPLFTGVLGYTTSFGVNTGGPEALSLYLNLSRSVTQFRKDPDKRFWFAMGKHAFYEDNYRVKCIHCKKVIKFAPEQAVW